MPDLIRRAALALKPLLRRNRRLAARRSGEQVRESLVTPLLSPTHRRRHGGRRNRRRRCGLHTAEVFEQRTLLAAATITVSGSADWVAASGTVYPLAGARVEIRDADAIGSDDLITTVTTDKLGGFTETITYDDGPLSSPDIYLKFLTISKYADFQVTYEGGEVGTYEVWTDVVELSDGATHTFPKVRARPGTLDGAAFNIHTSLVTAGDHAVKMLDSAPPPITVQRSVGGPRLGGSYNHGTGKITVHDTSGFAIGGSETLTATMVHEYGHYVADTYGFLSRHEQNPIYDDSNLSDLYSNKPQGLGVAWDEGFAEFWTTTAGLRNTWGNLESPRVAGEDQILSVGAVLTDLADSRSDGLDRTSMGSRSVVQLLTSAKPKTLGALWSTLARNAATPRARAELGGIFSQAAVAPSLQSPEEGETISSRTPTTFRWTANGAGSTHPLDQFIVRFYGNNFSELLHEHETRDTSYTPDDEDWKKILATPGDVKWVVLGKNGTSPASPSASGNPEDGYYWSEARTIQGLEVAMVIDDTGSMSEEIAGVRSALQNYIARAAAEVPEGEDPPTMQLLTFKDFVTTRITSNDLTAVSAAAGRLVASGGGDCPEASLHALRQAVDNTAPGGTILVATDAAPRDGISPGEVIRAAQRKRIRIHTILSGDCDSEALSTGGGLPAEGAATGFAATHARSVILADPEGDSPETATPLDRNPVSPGTFVGLNDPRDVLVADVIPGRVHELSWTIVSGPGLRIVVRDADGDSTLKTLTARSTGSATFEAPASGTVSLTVTSLTADAESQYQLDVNERPFGHLTSGVEIFSTISAATGGVFLVRDDVNAGAAAEYESAIANVLGITLGASVVSAEPRVAPQGESLTVTLSGDGTDWKQGLTSVDFSNPGLVVDEVRVASATRLFVSVTVTDDAAPSLADVTVTTVLGDVVQTAVGGNVLQVAATPTKPQIVSVTPHTLAVGSESEVTIRTAAVAWDASTTVDLGAGITVSDLRVGDGELRLSVDVADDSAIGFRTAEIRSDTETVSLARALFVSAAPSGLPRISALDVASGARGDELTVVIRGTDTSFVDGETTASFGTGIDVLELTVTGPETATVRISIHPDARGGFRDVSVQTGEETAVRLAGFFVEAPDGSAAGTIPGRTWHDSDANAIRDDGEDLLNGWSVELQDASGTVVATTTTGVFDLNGDGKHDAATESGVYRFENVAPGNYRVALHVPAGWTQSHPDEPAVRAAFELDQAEHIRFTGNDYRDWGGLGERWVMGDSGWHYITPDGVVLLWTPGPQDSLSGTPVARLSPAFHADISRLYLAAPPDVHRVRVTSNGVISDQDFGVHGTATMTGRQWHDFDRDGVRDEREPWLDGRPVALRDAVSGELVATTSTTSRDLNSDGRIDPATERGVYQFERVAPGDYTIEPVESSGWEQSFPLHSSEATVWNLDQSRQFEAGPNDFLNWGGRNERWVRSASHGWHFITPFGQLYAWDGSPATRLSGTFVAMLSPEYYSDLSGLTHAAAPMAAVVTVAPDANVIGTDVGTYRMAPTGCFGSPATDADAGDVTVSIIAGDLFVIGDSGNNQIAIYSDSGNQLVAIGLQGTLVNGGADPVVLLRDASLIPDNVHIRTAGGDDLVCLSHFDVANDVSVRTGSGTDTVLVHNLSIGDDLRIHNAAGDSLVSISATDVGDDLRSIGGGGSDSVLLTQVTISGRTSSVLHGGDDHLLVSRSRLEGNVAALLGSGDDAFHSVDADVPNAPLRVFAGAGDDNVVVESPRATDSGDRQVTGAEHDALEDILPLIDRVLADVARLGVDPALFA